MGEDVEAGGLEPMYAYPRATVDEFIRASELEKQRLAAAIEDDEHRARRARAAIGMHHMMVSMLIETQRELEELRREAERIASDIIAAASDGRALGRDMSGAGGRGTTAAGRGGGVPPSIDLLAESRLDAATGLLAPPDEPGPAASASAVPLVDDEADAESNEYFAFLREALTDDEPLGPRNAVGAAE
jgi:hypothetical protein